MTQNNKNRLFFHIDFKTIPPNFPLLPFNIYLFNPVSHNYTQIHKNGSIFSPESYDDLKNMATKGAIIAISMNHKKSFLKATNLQEADIPDLAPEKKHDLLIEHEILLQNVRHEFKPKVELLKAIDSSDYYSLIVDVKDQIQLFDVRISPTTTLCRDMAKKILFDDTPNNRITALCFCLAKLSGIANVSELSTLLVASMLHHIGMLSLDFGLYQELPSKIPEKLKTLYYKHPALSVNTIRKSGLALDQHCLQIILEHHERTDGSGKPNGTKGDKIDPLSLILGACSHFVEYSIATRTPLKRVLEYQKKGEFISGLENKFGDIIKKGIEQLIS